MRVVVVSVCAGRNLTQANMSAGVAQTKVYAYEVALFGEFFPRDLKAILDRITLYTESAAPMQTHEVVFEQLGTSLLQSQGDDPVLLRARKEAGDGKESPWSASLSVVSG